MNEQLLIDFGAIARDEGIEQALIHANEVHDKWSERAYNLLVMFVTPLKINDTFLIEDFRRWATHLDLLPEPPSLRAFGAIAVRARKNKLIRFISFDHVTNVKAHHSTVSRYAKGIC